MFILLLFLLLDIIYSLRISFNDLKPLDNPYEDDIPSSIEAYHHIITSFSAAGYIDYYKGIYYKRYLCCSWGYTYYGHYRCRHSLGSYQIIENYTQLYNFNETNLKELLHYGCTPMEEEGQMNILFDYQRYTNDSIVSLQIRMTNINLEPLEFNLAVCTGTKGSGSEKKCVTFSPFACTQGEGG